MKDMSNLHTLISDLFGVVKYCSLKGEGRRDLEVGLCYGVNMKLMITLESIEFSFLDIYHTLVLVFFNEFVPNSTFRGCSFCIFFIEILNLHLIKLNQTKMKKMFSWVFK